MATTDDDAHLARIAIRPSADNVLLDDEDLACLGSLVAAITHGQAHMALGATHPALLQHHSQALTQVLRRQDQVILSVQPFSDMDGLLQQFNLLLEQVSVRDARRAPLKTAPTHIWLLPAAQAYTSDTLQTLQRVLRDFPGLKLRLAFFLEGELGDSALAQWPNLWCWQVAGLDAPRVQALRERAARLGLDAAAETWLTRCGEAPQDAPPTPAPAPQRRSPPWRTITRGSLALLSLMGLTAAGWWALQHPADAQAAWARAQSDVLTPAQAWVKRQIAGLKSPMQAWNPPPLNPETPKPTAGGLAHENTPANAAPTAASDGASDPATTGANAAASATATGELGPAATPQDHAPGLPSGGETDTPKTAPLAASDSAAPSAAPTVGAELAAQVPAATASPATVSSSDAPATTATVSLPTSPTAPPSAAARPPAEPVPLAALPLPVAVRATPDAPRSQAAPAQATVAPPKQASRSAETSPNGADRTKSNAASAGAAAPTPTPPNPSPASAKATAKAVPNERPSPQTLATAAASAKASPPVAAPSPQPRPERQTNATPKSAPAPKPADTTAKGAAPVARNTVAPSPADARASTLADINSRNSASTNAVKGILTQAQDLAPFEVSSRVFNALRDRAILTVATPGAEPKASEAQQKAWVRALPDDKWLLEHGRFESPEAAALWAGSHPGLQHAHMTPLRGSNGKPIYALVTGPFTDQAAAQDYADALAGDAAAPPLRLGAELKQQLAP